MKKHTPRIAILSLLILSVQITSGMNFSLEKQFEQLTIETSQKDTDKQHLLSFLQHYEQPLTIFKNTPCKKNWFNILKAIDPQSLRDLLYCNETKQARNIGLVLDQLNLDLVKNVIKAKFNQPKYLYDPDYRDIFTLVTPYVQSDNELFNQLQKYCFKKTNISSECRLNENNKKYTFRIKGSPDGKQIVSWVGHKTTHLWDVSSKSCIKQFDREDNFDDTDPMKSFEIFSIAWSPDGNHLFCCAECKNIEIWNVASGLCIKKIINEHTASITSLEWSSDHNYLISADGHRTIKVWRTSDYQCIQTINETDGCAYYILWNPHYNVCAMSLSNRPVKIWDTTNPNNYKCIDILKIYNTNLPDPGYANPPDISWSPDGNKLALDLSPNQFFIWNLKTGTYQCFSMKHKKSVRDFEYIRNYAWSPDAQMLITGTSHGKIILWDVDCCKPIKILLSSQPKSYIAINDILWSPDNTYFASVVVTQDRRIRFWDIRLFSQLYDYLAHHLDVSSLLLLLRITKKFLGTNYSSPLVLDYQSQLIFDELGNENHEIRNVLRSLLQPFIIPYDPTK